jgi:hypothetical protein
MKMLIGVTLFGLLVVACGDVPSPIGIKECGEACKNTGVQMEAFSPKEGCKCMRAECPHPVSSSAKKD